MLARGQLVLNPFHNDKENVMNIDDLPSILDLLYAIGEILSTTWPGRIVLGAVIGSVLARFPMTLPICP
jgi:hypothetical protein